ncbi:DUF3575 domain-containing protein [Chryseobacterium lacus]|uniref:DUF3575 domain-containing protein n=1 Tax=Chryseobacterium lacus TaxID=2058346 RepID=A0A368MZA0_9FLAO|nr:MAG: hypothetical protein ABS44_01095 [Chryseobacterium sp. SCN 40-13]RCU42655.1 DUF3575 domain-containing protein [Chryseobacterium lacus]RST27212.1 DUF3575 domain-containing protein [Chryseobacterium lacus]RST28242.1 DUF3575 domain-containing protein [Chryseobacterium lacus]
MKSNYFFCSLFFFLTNFYNSQKNELAIQSSFTNIGISYEYFTGKKFSFGAQAGTGLFGIKKNELIIMTSNSYSSKNLTEFYTSPFVRYYFRDDFNTWFLMGEIYFSKVQSTLFINEVESNKTSKKYFGPALGGGYKFKLNNRFTINTFITVGYDFNENDLVPLLGNGLISLGYQF